MIKHIQPAMFHQIHSRKLHDLPDLCFILTMVTLIITFLTHGFGVMGAFYSYGQAVSEEPRAILTEKGFLLFNFLDVKSFERKGSFCSVMMLPAEDPDELYQGTNIVLLFVRDFHLLHHLHTLPAPCSKEIIYLSTI